MFQDRSGQRIPDVTFRVRRDHEWADLSTDAIFNGRTVVVFSLPGAFTPTCSSSHVPRYNRLADAFKAAGVDEIVCVAVNDSFVMNQWKREQKADRITFVPDGNGEFTEAMGMTAPMEDLGFGKRSWRYSMLVRDGIIEKMFIEPVKPGDPFEVSDADTMLAWLAPNAERPRDVTVFSRPGCGFCAQAKAALDEAGFEYEELVLNRDYTDQTLRAVAGATSVPQIFVDGSHIGGATELAAWLEQSGNVKQRGLAA